MHTQRKDYTRAEKYYQQGLNLAKELNNKDHIVSYSNNLGLLALDHQRYQDARRYFERALSLA